MNYRRLTLASFSLLAIAAAMGPARADKTGVTFYTSAARATSFHCDIVNIGALPLQITTSVIGADGVALHSSGPPATTVLPGTEAGDDFDTTPNPDGSPNPTDGYCKYEVAGTGDRNQVRADLNANLLRTIPGTTTPIYLTKVLEAH